MCAGYLFSYARVGSLPGRPLACRRQRPQLGRSQKGPVRAVTHLVHAISARFQGKTPRSNAVPQLLEAVWFPVLQPECWHSSEDRPLTGLTWFD